MFNISVWVRGLVDALGQFLSLMSPVSHPQEAFDFHWR